ncbi:MAG: malto-oligosyltrehalose trehalohydrolase [Actinomycetia bacterium]|nr:malto-oligosyltrehalose trehalohydrolase [Actinomycetes bacterium]
MPTEGGPTRRIRVWAPYATSVHLITGSEAGQRQRQRQRQPMVPDPPTDATSGWWSVDVPGLAHGTAYGFSLDDGEPLPDPRSVWLPDGVHALTRHYDHDRFAWEDAGWTGRPLAGSVLYELHVGTFTAEGTFDAAIGHLDHLVDLGVDLVELMPVAAFDGTHGWGYDGVAPWSVHEPYGGPDGLKRFVDACHARGLGVLLDVVHNHLGPSGNYLNRYGPYETTDHSTPWGPAVNLDRAGSDEVRAYLLGGAECLLRHFHLDGLRLDAVHALYDDRALSFLEELSTVVAALAAELGRPLSLVAESDRNDPRLVAPVEEHGLGITAQWDDDVHHSVHALLTGERQGYYADFGALSTLGHALSAAFVHAGTWSTFRGRTHGRPVDRATTPGHRFVVAVQTHDQVGNRAQGERIGQLVPAGLAEIGAALVLTSVFTPMLFMGEEWGASTPWQFFTSFPDADTGARVTDGRRAEFATHGWTDTDVPDPQDPSTRAASVLDWAEVGRQPHARLHAWYRALIALRRAEPDLRDPRLDTVDVRTDESARWLVMARGGFRVVVNLAEEPQVVPVTAPVGRVVLTSGTAEPLPGGLRLAGRSVAVVQVSG